MPPFIRLSRSALWQSVAISLPALSPPAIYLPAAAALAGLMLATSTPGALAQSVTPIIAPHKANSTDTAMYFHSYVQDAEICAMTATGSGSIAFADGISNPSATCPDAFGWKQMLEAIQAEFWKNWAYDQTVWAAEPKPLCTSDADKDCCFVNSAAAEGEPRVGYRDAGGTIVAPSDIGAAAQYCPYIPGDYGGSAETFFNEANQQTSHNTTFLRSLDPARIARQRESEIVYRNDPFVLYATTHELYSVAGLKKTFRKIAGEAANSKPFRPTGQGVSFPPDAVMFKVDWIPEATMVSLGYVSDLDGDPSTPPNNATHPYVTMRMKVSAGPSAEPTTGVYYLAAITGASKALPTWHWYAFEHALNLGRCDYIGCNDSYGYSTPMEIAAPEQPDGSKTTATMIIQSNFIPPLVTSDQLKDGTALFDPGKRYPSGTISTGLADLFGALNIGTGDRVANPDRPSIADPAWRSYRLKGTQTQFYSTDGYPTQMGASITEGGFVNSASCMSCHVQASVVSSGAPNAASVGSTGRLAESGIGTVVQGAPYIGDYYIRGSTRQHAVQTDFVWGVLNAN